MATTARAQQAPAELLMGILDSLPENIALLDGKGTILLVNRAWRAFGSENGLRMPESGIGANYLDICSAARPTPGSPAGKACHAITEMLEGRSEGATFDYSCHAPDTLRWFVFQGSRIEHGGMRYVLVSHLDITARHLAEEARRASRNALDSFILLVSHDIRGPLRRIEELCAIASEPGAPPAGEVLARIRAEALRARKLAGDLLEISHVSSADVERTDVDLSALASDIVATLRAWEPQRRVSVDIEPGMQDHADARLVRVLLTNLLENAWKYTSEREEAHIAIGSSHDGEGRRSFFVRDDGIGFESAQAAELFRPFHRLAGARRFEGTGVGLAIVERATHRHGGRVWARSAPGEGAVFHFTLHPE